MNGLPSFMIPESVRPFGIALVSIALATYIAAISGIFFVEKRHTHADQRPTEEETRRRGKGVLSYITRHMNFWKQPVRQQDGGKDKASASIRDTIRSVVDTGRRWRKGGQPKVDQREGTRTADV